jgi:uncharacterized protein (TIGR00369 family)
VTADPRDELWAALDGLTDEQARTLLAWLGVMRRDQSTSSGAESPGPLADVLGIANEERSPGRCRMRLTVDPAWHNPNGVLHGGVIYTLIDYSMGGAIQPSLPPGEHCATIEVKVSYLASVREGTLTVETEVVKQGRNIAFTESKVTDDHGRLVATASGSMFIFRAGPQE